jgi:hypothetical protein
MKAQFKFAMTVLLSVWTMFTLSALPPKVTIVPSGSKSFEIHLEDLSKSTVQIRLADRRGEVLISEDVKSQETFARRYNLKLLPDGEYTLSVDDGMSTTLQPVLITDACVVIPSDREQKLFKPSVQVQDETGKIDFTLLCLNESLVTIRITDHTGNTSYVDSSNEQGSVQRRFDISALAPGKYTVQTTVRTGNTEKTYVDAFTHHADFAFAR